MIQQEMLQYQTLDRELNRIERDLRKNPFYVKRKELKFALQKGEEQLARMEQKTMDLRNQLIAANQSLQKIAAVIEEHTKEIADIEDQDELNYMSKKLDEQLELLSNVEKEIKQIVRDGEELDKSFENISKVQMPKLASDYNKCNAAFDKATQEAKPRVVEIKRQQAELRPSISPQLFEVYKRISEQTHPVFVPLENGNRCGGCRMEMPLAQVTAKLAEKDYMTCEHCGRIIYKK